MNRLGADPWLFGWDDTPGIVSVWATSRGEAYVWRRVSGELRVEYERFRPWLFAAHLEDLEYAGVSVEPNPEAPVSYHELEMGDVRERGDRSDLRFLLTARDGRALEGSLMLGAERRTGVRPRNLKQSGEYYVVGPVEQYLMWTGRTYFRDLAFEELVRLQFDLETTSLDPGEGRIFMVAMRDSTGWQQVLEAPRAADEAELIRGISAAIAERDPDVIENHNLMGFDLPYLEHRAAKHGIGLGFGRPPAPRGLRRFGVGSRTTRYTVAGRELLDTLDATRRVDFVMRKLPSHSLKAVARYFQIASDDRVEIVGKEVYPTYLRDPERVRTYAMQDVLEVSEVSSRLHRSAYALARMAPRSLERVAHAGTATGILEPMLIRAYLEARRALPAKPVPTSSKPHLGGAVRLYASGVVEHIVKADVASLYPSIIRTGGIGPRSDSLGAFHRIVSRLTEMRLAAKARSESGEVGTKEQAEHESVQAAMKLVINSAYGYLGAGDLAWFGDRRAADAITAIGRKTLVGICRELRNRGAVLIEADTDGVYFSVPDGWSEGDERRLVADVGETLERGLHLSFDGRFKAMFSHEIKNYALLHYDGTVTIRGAALMSRRAEPFAQAWLHRALGYLLQQDIPQIRTSYLDTVQRLLRGEEEPEAVAVRVRLTKTPAEYRRSERREAAYEAMLTSGRNSWRVGDLVQIYRASDGHWRLLKDGEALPYDASHYAKVLKSSYAERLAKAFERADFERLFRTNEQAGLFDKPIEAIRSHLVVLE
ncbi:MAG: ribonuclease H-like domain-containing protein [Trueperaceae bacterium]|nr:MAG: ribonuclease H-like domain-containing protein [Trueperaceae bacterium]